MGVMSIIECSKCGYGLQVTLDVSMAYSPSAVFYGHCDDPTQNWSIAIPAGSCKDGRPLLLVLVKSKKIRNKAFKLLANGATPEYDYGHALYVPKVHGPRQ